MVLIPRISIVLAGLLLPAGPAAGERVFVKATVTGIEQLSHNVKQVQLNFPDNYSFRPGQFALVRVPPAFVASWNARNRTKLSEVSRPYSFATDPAQLPAAGFIIQLAAPPPGKNVPPGIASTYIHEQLKRGDILEVSEPMGSLYEPDDVARPIVLVAGGTGVAPFVGLLEHWFRAKVNQKRKIYLFFGARQRRDLILHDQFARWAASEANFEYIPALSNAAAEDQWTGATGFINVVLDKHFPSKLDADVLLAGSPRMMEETVKVVKAKGVPPNQIRHDPIQVAP
jgi:NAD(P)H-flavin reductase